MTSRMQKPKLRSHNFPRLKTISHVCDEEGTQKLLACPVYKKDHTHLFPTTRETLQQIMFRMVYLLCVYIFVALLFFGYMRVLFYFTVLDDGPRLTGNQSCLRMNPGISMVPNPSTRTSLIYVHTTAPASYAKLSDEMTAFLANYQIYITGGMMAECETRRPYLNSRRPCRYPLDASGPCNSYMGYGYFRGQPCFALKLNRIYGWLPDPIANSTGVRVKCEGITETDSVFLGDICYYDIRSFRTRHSVKKGSTWCSKDYGQFEDVFYPFINQANYHSPLVFVQFLNPKRHVVIFIKCYAIARNVRVNLNQNEGSVMFQLLVE